MSQNPNQVTEIPANPAPAFDSVLVEFVLDQSLGVVLTIALLWFWVIPSLKNGNKREDWINKSLLDRVDDQEKQNRQYLSLLGEAQRNQAQMTAALNQNTQTTRDLGHVVEKMMERLESLEVAIDRLGGSR